jgi:rare lipoprotein A
VKSVPRSLRPYPLARRLAAILAIAVALACGPLQQPQAESAGEAVELEWLPEEFAGSFEERYSSTRELPTFARPEIATMLLALPLIEETASVVAQADRGAPQDLGAEGVAAADDKSPMQVVKDLLISPAQGAEPPFLSTDEVATPAAPRQPEQAATAAASPDPDGPSWTAEVVPQGRGEQAVAEDRGAGGQAEVRKPAEPKRIAAGPASYYEHPGRTASGEAYDPNKLTAAHKKLPFGTRVRVVNRNNGRSVVVRINDRAPREMPFVIDLSRGSARALGIGAKDGVASVAVYKAD